MGDESSFKGYKKKKKKSYLSRAKKFGKSGRFGHGTHISEDVYNYFVRVVEINNGKFDTEEEREMFISNTFEQTIGQEVSLATNQFTSYAIERLIPKAKDEPLEKFMTALATDLRPLCCDQFASFVIESLLKCAAERIKVSRSDEDNSWHEKYIAWIMKIGRFLLNNVEEFAWDQYANRIMRTVVLTCCGCTAPSKKTPVVVESSTDKVKVKKEVPREMKTLLKDYCTTFTSLPQLGDLTKSPLTSGLLQSVVQAASVAGAKRVAPLAEKILEVLKCQGAPLDDPSARLLEALLASVPAPLFSSTYDEFFKGKLASMASHASSNFSVQRLLDSCPDKELLQPILEELNSATVMESLLKTQHTGVLLAMAQACHRLGSGQGAFIQNLMSALQCGSPPERQLQVVPLVVSLHSYEKHNNMQSEEQTLNCTLHGSLLLQALLNFNKPIKFVQSLLSLKPTVLAALLSDCKGSHVTNAFMSSSFVGEKSREKLCQHLKGQWAGMACSVWGSRSLDAIWQASSVKSRQTIVSELSQHLPKLKADKHGRFMVQQTGAELFKHNSTQWVEAQSKTLSIKRLFADILDTDSPSKKTKKS